MTLDLPGGGSHRNRALLEELLELLQEAGFDIQLQYLVEIDLDELVEEIVELILKRKKRRGWFSKK